MMRRFASAQSNLIDEARANIDDWGGVGGTKFHEDY